MLTLLSSDTSTRGGRLNVAAAHLQHAMAHLNAAACEQVPAETRGATPELEELRQAIYALNDLLVDVAGLNRRVPATPASAGGRTRPFDTSSRPEVAHASAPLAREA